uniref:Spindle and kinetochore-associated protein 1 n=1 Tax=Parastrongyloides trichosuri TaxID=131310 RepID=A0A0N5A059_PARTI
MPGLKTILRDFIANSKCIQEIVRTESDLVIRFLETTSNEPVISNIVKFADFFKNLQNKTSKPIEENIFEKYLKKHVSYEYDKIQRNRVAHPPNEEKHKIPEIRQEHCEVLPVLSEEEKLEMEIGELLSELLEITKRLPSKLAECNDKVTASINLANKLSIKSLKTSSYEKQRFMYNMKKCDLLQEITEMVTQQTSAVKHFVRENL